MNIQRFIIQAEAFFEADCFDLAISTYHRAAQMCIVEKQQLVIRLGVAEDPQLHERIAELDKLYVEINDAILDVEMSKLNLEVQYSTNEQQPSQPIAAVVPLKKRNHDSVFAQQQDQNDFQRASESQESTPGLNSDNDDDDNDDDDQQECEQRVKVMRRDGAVFRLLTCPGLPFIPPAMVMAGTPRPPADTGASLPPKKRAMYTPNERDLPTTDEQDEDNCNSQFNLRP